MSTPTSTEMDADACRRALDYYLDPLPEELPELSRIRTITAHCDLSSDEAREQLLWALRCASANAAEAIRQLKGRQQEQMMTVAHLVNLAWAMYEHYLKKRDQEHADDTARHD